MLDTVLDARCERIFLPVKNRIFTLTRFMRRFCIGRYNLENYVSSTCPFVAELDTPAVSCSQCLKASGFNPAFYNVAEMNISPQQKIYNQKEHVVYLAFFGVGVVKVGIATAERVKTRLLEQGARAATILRSYPDAYAAREIEELIHKVAGIPESVKIGKKMQLLNQHFSYDDAMIELKRAKNIITEKLSIDFEDHENVDLSAYYYNNGTVLKNLINVSDETPLIISGTCLGMVGDALIMEQSNIQFMASLKKYVSHIIQIDDFEQLNKYTPETEQISLF
jgi:hypothetical protein